MKTLKCEVFDLTSTKNELGGKIYHYKQSLKSVEESLLGNIIIYLSEYHNIFCLSTCRNKNGKEFTFD